MNAHRDAESESIALDDLQVDSQTQIPQKEDMLYSRSQSCFDRYDLFIDQLLEAFSALDIEDNQQPGRPHAPRFLEVLQRFFQAGAVYLYHVDNLTGELKINAAAESMPVDSKIASSNMTAILRQIVVQVPRPRYTMMVPYEIDQQESYFYLVPLDPHDEPDNLIIFRHNRPDVTSLDVTAGVILQGLYNSTNHFSQMPAITEIKAAIIDELKRSFRFVSNELYTFRYEQFCASLSSIEMHFEPIIQFDKMHQGVTIFGWEALARYQDRQTTPVEIFAAAELWGVEFQTALDLFCLGKAVRTYHALNTKLKNTRYGEVRPLTVNVFANSILRAAYSDMLKQLLETERLLAKNKLILEISEKTLIRATTSSEEQRFLKQFQRVINYLRRQFGLNFAIDDFGVGNSSISRLNKLLPGYVKIDRDILHYNHDLGRELIKYVNNVATKIPGIGINIIVEGLDHKSKISLRELVCELEIEYIQGYKFREASPEITNRLNKEMYRALFRELKWPLKR